LNDQLDQAARVTQPVDVLPLYAEESQEAGNEKIGVSGPQVEPYEDEGDDHR
jgi:hypothetical protein